MAILLPLIVSARMAASMAGRLSCWQIRQMWAFLRGAKRGLGTTEDVNPPGMDTMLVSSAVLAIIFVVSVSPGSSFAYRTICGGAGIISNPTPVGVGFALPILWGASMTGEVDGSMGGSSC